MRALAPHANPTENIAVPRGDYKLFAWEVLPNTAYMNAEFMAKYESLGQAVTVSAGGNFDLSLIPAEFGR
jgi:hypothetical protein